MTANLLAADCAVLPYREGASLRHGSLMAALAHGLPIVSTALVGCPCRGDEAVPDAGGWRERAPDARPTTQPAWPTP